jgi:hypothetical protein
MPTFVRGDNQREGESDRDRRERDPVTYVREDHHDPRRASGPQVSASGLDRDAVTVAVEPEHAGAPEGQTIQREQ